MEKIKKLVPCDRCDGAGASMRWAHTGMTCWKCGGSKVMEVTEIIRNEKEQVTYEKQKAYRQAKKVAEMEKRAAEYARAEAERLAKEEAEIATREAERKANLYKGFVGSIGDKLTTNAKALFVATFEVASFSGYGTTTMSIYSFETEDRKMIIWKTGSYIEDFEPEANYKVTGTVKEFTTYHENEQTVLVRVKATKI